MWLWAESLEFPVGGVEAVSPPQSLSPEGGWLPLAKRRRLIGKQCQPAGYEGPEIKIVGLPVVVSSRRAQRECQHLGVRCADKSTSQMLDSRHVSAERL